MSLPRWAYVVLAVILAAIFLFAVRMHMAAGQVAPREASGNAEAGRLSVQAWCTECHSVQPETAGTGKFAPDFSAIAQRRPARWLERFLRSKHTLMPDFVLNRRESDDIIAYMLSLKKS